MPLPTRQVVNGLERKGFEEKPGKKHRNFRYYTTEGIKTAVVTHVSYGSSGKQIPEKVISKMAGQCRITTPQFKELIECQLTRESYEELLDTQ